ncbi:uncharacterized protein CLUP02_10002 [Colletotrichum lupini]|uniref:Uncharacterized protein n=1 Tax=Colletotrichum lupini TaxID=145971 RepID=A0A9Q8SWQ1_9PEZI|nr:uncharacterized protein CLUP02_10002 [Colletotrichum lupini]UQC84505.1 hypothetical protein CLUP02_10002 [Colletotrichum lupini]
MVPVPDIFSGNRGTMQTSTARELQREGIDAHAGVRHARRENSRIMTDSRYITLRMHTSCRPALQSTCITHPLAGGEEQTQGRDTRLGAKTSLLDSFIASPPPPSISFPIYRACLPKCFAGEQTRSKTCMAMRPAPCAFPARPKTRKLAADLLQEGIHKQRAPRSDPAAATPRRISKVAASHPRPLSPKFPRGSGKRRRPSTVHSTIRASRTAGAVGHLLNYKPALMIINSQDKSQRAPNYLTPAPSSHQPHHDGAILNGSPGRLHTDTNSTSEHQVDMFPPPFLRKGTCPAQRVSASVMKHGACRVYRLFAKNFQALWRPGPCQDRRKTVFAGDNRARSVGGDIFKKGTPFRSRELCERWGDRKYGIILPVRGEHTDLHTGDFPSKVHTYRQLQSFADPEENPPDVPVLWMVAAPAGMSMGAVMVGTCPSFIFPFTFARIRPRTRYIYRVRTGKREQGEILDRTSIPRKEEFLGRSFMDMNSKGYKVQKNVARECQTRTGLQA